MAANADHLSVKFRAARYHTLVATISDSAPCVVDCCGGIREERLTRALYSGIDLDTRLVGEGLSSRG